MKQLCFTLFLLILFVTIQAQERMEYDGKQSLKEIPDSWLIVRLPGFEKKLAALDSLLERTDLTETTRQKLERARGQTLADRDFIHQWYPVAFDSAYTFSRFAFIYSHETEEFQSNIIPARASGGQAVFYAREGPYFFATLDGYAGDRFRFTDSSHRLLGYPFPNNLAMPGILIPGMAGNLPEWIAVRDDDQGQVYRVYKHAVRINRKLNKSYRRQYLSVQSASPDENQ